MLPDYRIRQRDYLLEIAQTITEELNLDKLLSRILRVSAEMLAGQAGLLVLRGEQGGWRVAVSHGVPKKLLKNLDPLFAEIPDHEDPARFELPEINRMLQNLARIASLRLLTGVGLPMIARQRVIGLIFLFRSYAGVFSQNDRRLLQSFADQAAVAVHNAQLYSQVSTEKQRLDALLDAAADGILILNPDHRIDKSNQAFQKLWGGTVEEIHDQFHEEIIQWKDRKHGSTLEEAEAGGWPLTPTATLYIEGDLVRPAGLPLPVGITYAPLLSSEGNLINIIATVRDISHFREAEELKSTFISVISHELKTPVALIKGYVGTLRRDDVNWDRAIIADSLKVIEEEADRLTEMIDNLLDASRLQAGGLSINLSDVSLEQLTGKIVDRFKTQTSTHNFKIDFTENFPVVLADDNRINQVLSNMLSNSIKYSPQGGGITIYGRVYLNQVVICVQDQGPGIAPTDIPHIFDRFYRSDDAARTSKGAGLGLFLTRAIVEAHNGRIWVDAEQGNGAKICFSLPR